MSAESYVPAPEHFDALLRFRRAVRVFDADAPYDPAVTTRCLRRATLAPSSSNLQFWEFYRIVDPDKRRRLNEACFNQPAARTARELIVVVTRLDLWRQRIQANVDFLRTQFGGVAPDQLTPSQRNALFYYEKTLPSLFRRYRWLGWLRALAAKWQGRKRPAFREVRPCDLRISAHHSVGMAVQTFMLAMAAEGYDTCPIGGYDSRRVRRILRLPKGAEVNCIVACGRRAPEGVYGPRFRLPFEAVYFEV